VTAERYRGGGATTGELDRFDTYGSIKSGRLGNGFSEYDKTEIRQHD